MGRKILIVTILVGLLVVAAAPAFASNVCPVTGGPNDPTVKGTPATVPDKSGNPAHGTQDGSGAPVNPQPGDVFWN